MDITTDDVRRFWRAVQRTSTCWIWIGSHVRSSGGYGRFTFKERLLLAHRFSYEVFVGAIPQGMQIDHLCQRRECVNPDHLEVTSGITNLLRGNGQGAINARKTHCKRGHPFDDANTYLLPSGKGRACLICRKQWTLDNAEQVRESGKRSTAAYRARQKAKNSSLLTLE